MNQLLVAGAMALVLCLSATQLLGQDRGGRKGGPGGGGPGGPGAGFDPAQMQQRFLDRIRETLEVKSDDEWTVLQPRLQKVMDAQRSARSGSMSMLFSRGGPSGGKDSKGGSSTRSGTMPEAEALQKALDAKATNAELKAALDKYVAARKAKETELEAAQADLRKIITVRQEALLSMWGLL